MIQFNLLPDLKLQYIKAKRIKRSVIVISFLAAATSFAIFVFLFLTVYVFQKNHIKNVTNDIKLAQEQLSKTKNLNKVLTIQNQLNSLPALHDQKPVAGRLFTYITQITPASVNIGKTDISFVDNTISFEGTSDSLSNVNKFVDTIKFTNYQIVVNPQDEPDTAVDIKQNKPFSEVVLSAFSVAEDGKITYTITSKYNPIIFDSKQQIVLVVPKITSTRSETEKPNDLFKALPEKKAEGQ